MGVKTQIVIFHGVYNTEDNKTYPTKINVLSSTDVFNQLKNTQINEVDIQLINPPIRFKLADNDDADLQFPLAIPSPQDDNTIYYSYRKVIKIQFIPDGVSDTIIQNLRVYIDTGKTDSQGRQIMDKGVLIFFKPSITYTPQSVTDVTNGLGDDQLNQLQYTKLQQLQIQTGIVYDTKTNWRTQINTSNIQTYIDTITQKFFGNQPYLNLIVGLTKEQDVGVSSWFNIYYVYDEI